MPARILIVDDQQIVREGMIAMFEDAPEVAIVGEAADGAQAIELYAGLHPDVVLMDLQMPEIDGLEATRRIRGTNPNAQILILTTYATDGLIAKALQAGARGYMLKDAPADEILAAIRLAL